MATIVNGVDYAYQALQDLKTFLDKRTANSTYYTVEQITGTTIRVTAANPTSKAVITKLDVVIYPSPTGS